jgi:hypothetical protein
VLWALLASEVLWLGLDVSLYWDDFYVGQAEAPLSFKMMTILQTWAVPAIALVVVAYLIDRAMSVRRP